MYIAPTHEAMRAFDTAVSRVMHENEQRGSGIGELGERTLHAVIKRFYEPQSELTEQKIGSFYADIACGKQIVEIQTRAFDKLRRKLTYFINNGYHVTVVYPVAQVKRITLIDVRGTLKKPRKSPKTGTVYDIVPELYKLLPVLVELPDQAVSFHVLLLDISEYRIDDKEQKICRRRSRKGYVRFERIPNALLGRIELCGKNELAMLIPEEIRCGFTSKDVAAAAHISLHTAQTLLTILCRLGAIEHIGAKDRYKEYRCVTHENSEEEHRVLT